MGLWIVAINVMLVHAIATGRKVEVHKAPAYKSKEKDEKQIINYVSILCKMKCDLCFFGKISIILLPYLSANNFDEKKRQKFNIHLIR